MVAKNRTRPSLTDRYLGAGAATLALVGIVEKAAAESPKTYGDLVKKLAKKNCDVVAVYGAFLARRRQKTGTSPSSDVVDLFVDDIYPSPENEGIYRPIDANDPEIIALGQSIAEHGLRESIVVTVDGWILSGHRRHCGAKLAGLAKVPCRIEPINRDDDQDEFIRLLREYNRNRDKTNAEKLREELVTINPTDAYQSLVEFREAESHVQVSAMTIVGKKRRCRITSAKKPMLDAILAILEARREYWPLSDRFIHYQLLNAPPLKHASKPRSTYANDPKSYKSLTDLLTRGRLIGDIPWDAIGDETRPVITWNNVCADARVFMRRQLNGFLKNYWRDLMLSQPNHIEILAEKNTLLSIIKPVAMEYCIPLTVGRGYSSLPPRHAMAQRYRQSGKEKLLLVIVSDFDPDGEEIAQSFARSMRDDFGIDIHAIKVAITAEQVVKFNLPPMMEAKKSSSNHAKFVKNHGSKVWEVEALSPEQLQSEIRATIDRVIDVAAFNAELENEKQDSAFLAAAQKRAVEALSGIDFGADA